MSIPRYVRGRGVSEANDKYATDGLKDAVREQSSMKLNMNVTKMLSAIIDLKQNDSLATQTGKDPDED